MVKSVRLMNVLISLILAFAMLPIQIVSAAPQAEITRDTLFVPGEVLVSFPEGITAEALRTRANALAAESGGQLSVTRYNLALLSYSEESDVAALVSQINARDEQVVAQPNYVYGIPEQRLINQKPGNTSDYTLKNQLNQTITLSQTDLAQLRHLKTVNNIPTVVPTFPVEVTGSKVNLWGWERVNAEVFWANSAPSKTICVVDSGIDYLHPDLYGRILNGYDFVNSDSLPNDDNGHGTHVAGIIAAKPNNGSATAVGISTGKILSVKVLNYRGYGTSLWLAAGIRYCADAASTMNVKVINLSLGGGYNEKAVYDALYVATFQKQQLVTASAGDNTSAADYFPAAWGTVITPPPPDALGGSDYNIIHFNLISVGAAHINPASQDLPVWVDVNGSDGIDDGELYEDCATSTSNYGVKVNLVAPGDFIYSTTPVSYPFYLGIAQGISAGFEYLSGTSTAAPFVAATAARAYTLRPEYSRYYGEMKAWLIERGDPLQLAVDPDPAIDPNIGYNNPGFGVQQVLTDAGSQTVYKAPFCWPSWSGAFGMYQEMGSATYLNAANALGLTMLWGRVRDAQNGLPLKDALVKAVRTVYMGNGYSTTLDTVKISANSDIFLILNVPNYQYGAVPYPIKITLSVAKPGYTYGYQLFDSFSHFDYPDTFAPGSFHKKAYTGFYSGVSIPPSSSNIAAVMEWWLFPDRADLDLMAWLPNSTTKPRGYISPDRLAPMSDFSGYLPAYPTDLSFGLGSLLSPTQVGDPNYKAPYVVMSRDGGISQADGGLAPDGIPLDTLTIKGSSLTGAYYPGSYTLMATDYSRWYDQQGIAHNCSDFNPATSFGCRPAAIYQGSRFEKPIVDPVVRLWQNGRLLKTVRLLDSTDSNCLSGADFWKIATIKGKTVTVSNTCGSAYQAGSTNTFGVFPYPSAAEINLYPKPILSSVAPNQGAKNIAINLTLSGSNFNNGSVVYFDSIQLKPTFISNEKLTVFIPSSMMTIGDHLLRIYDPAVGSGDSNSLTFSVH